MLGGEFHPAYLYFGVLVLANNLNNEPQIESALPITVKSLTKTYGDVFALNNVDVDIKSGEFLTLLGPSGSGKTTLLMAIAGFNRPDSGSIKFGHDEMILTPPHKRDVGMVFQSYALFPHMTVAENVAFPLKLRKVNTSEITKRVATALETVQLGELGNRDIDQLSGGQRQRVALARAFVFKPRILLMDEPLSALDKKLREQMQIELKQLHRQLGVTTVYVTHDQREALTMSDRIAIINRGEIVQIDTPDVIYNSPSNSFVADFIGESTILPLQMDSAGKLLFEHQTISNGPPGNLNDNGKGWALVVRPERVFISQKSTNDNDRVISFDGIVKEFVFQGDSAFALVTVAEKHELSVRFGTNSASFKNALQPGDKISLGLHISDITIIPGSES